MSSIVKYLANLLNQENLYKLAHGFTQVSRQMVFLDRHKSMFGTSQIQTVHQSLILLPNLEYLWDKWRFFGGFIGKVLQGLFYWLWIEQVLVMLALTQIMADSKTHQFLLWRWPMSRAIRVISIYLSILPDSKDHADICITFNPVFIGFLE